MNDIKNTLLLLCKEIKYICNIDLKIEHIRLAKFNEVSENNVETLWLVLQTLCHQLTRQEPDKACDVLYVKKCFASWMYERIAFYKLSASRKHGSRELLIALAWLIAKRDVFDTLVTYKIWNLEKQIKNVASVIETDNPDRKGNVKNLTFEDNLNYILLLCGKIKHNLKHIIEYDEERIKLVNKIHEATQVIDGVPHLSVDEAKLFLQDKPNPFIQKMITELQIMLSTHQKWKDKSCIFWEWMDSVLEKADLDAGISNIPENNEPLIEILQVLLANINSKLKDTDKDGCDGTSPALTGIHIPAFILSPEGSPNKPFKLKILQEIVHSELSVIKKATKEMEMDLYSELKNIAENKLGPSAFVIPQIYSK